MVENNEKLQLLYFRDTRISQVADIPASQVQHLPIMHHFPHKATLILKGTMDLKFYCYAFIFKSWALMG